MDLLQWVRATNVSSFSYDINVIRFRVRRTPSLRNSLFYTQLRKTRRGTFLVQ